MSKTMIAMLMGIVLLCQVSGTSSGFTTLGVGTSTRPRDPHRPWDFRELGLTFMLLMSHICPPQTTQWVFGHHDDLSVKTVQKAFQAGSNQTDQFYEGHGSQWRSMAAPTPSSMPSAAPTPVPTLTMDLHVPSHMPTPAPTKAKPIPYEKACPTSDFSSQSSTDGLDTPLREEDDLLRLPSAKPQKRALDTSKQKGRAKKPQPLPGKETPSAPAAQTLSRTKRRRLTSETGTATDVFAAIGLGNKNPTKTEGQCTNQDNGNGDETRHGGISGDLLGASEPLPEHLDLLETTPHPVWRENPFNPSDSGAPFTPQVHRPPYIPRSFTFELTDYGVDLRYSN